jgi:type VI protein secretion system component Hcp
MEDPRKQYGAGQIADNRKWNAELSASEAETVVGGAPSVQHSDLTVTKKLDASSANLYQ